MFGRLREELEETRDTMHKIEELELDEDGRPVQKLTISGCKVTNDAYSATIFNKKRDACDEKTGEMKPYAYWMGADEFMMTNTTREVQINDLARYGKVMKTYKEL